MHLNAEAILKKAVSATMPELEELLSLVRTMKRTAPDDRTRGQMGRIEKAILAIGTARWYENWAGDWRLTDGLAHALGASLVLMFALGPLLSLVEVLHGKEFEIPNSALGVGLLSAAVIGWIRSVVIHDQKRAIKAKMRASLKEKAGISPAS